MKPKPLKELTAAGTVADFHGIPNYPIIRTNALQKYINILKKLQKSIP
jgi:hypothetical protein